MTKNGKSISNLIKTCQFEYVSVLKNMTVRYATDLVMLARSCKQLCLLCLPDQWNLQEMALLRYSVDYNAPGIMVVRE